MNELTIGQLARRAQVNVETIRYYERQELIPKPPRLESGYRLYSEEMVTRIQFIKRAKALGFSLKEISDLISIYINPDSTCNDVKKKALIKIAEVEEKIRSLQGIKKTLTRLVASCSETEPARACPIIETLHSDNQKTHAERMFKNFRKTVFERISDSNLTPQENRIRKHILREFARNGRPPSIIEIKKGLNLSSVKTVRQTIDILERADLLSTKGEAIITSYPFSREKTDHKVVFESGLDVYALCAMDAIGIHFMLKKNITIISKCPHCGKRITITVKDNKIGHSDPPEVVQFFGSKQSCGTAVDTACPFINFFCSAEHLNKWKEHYSINLTGDVYSLNKALKMSRMLFENFLK